MTSFEVHDARGSDRAHDIGRCCLGVKVLDASRVLAGPFCGAILADLGADVIRVEPPAGSDEVRNWAPMVDGVSAAFTAVNHTKRGLVLDLSSPGGVEIFRKLLAISDVLIENFRHGTMERFGLPSAELRAINSRLIHCAVRAFPTGTRDEQLPGYEASIQAYSGIMSVTGEHDGAPVRCGPSVTDLGTGIVSALAVLAALRERDRTGLGGMVEPALLRTASNLLSYQIAGYSLTGAVPQRRGSGHEALVPYGVFNASDGPILIAGGNDKLWALTCKVLKLDCNGSVPYSDLTGRIANRAAVNALVGDAVGHWARQVLLDRLIEAGVPAAPVQTVPELMSDPTLLEAGVLQTMATATERPITMAGRLFGVEGDAPDRHPPPALGEHTRAILAELGYDEFACARLAAAGTVR